MFTNIIKNCKNCLKVKKPNEGNLKKIVSFRVDDTFNQNIELYVLHIHSNNI